MGSSCLVCGEHLWLLEDELSGKHNPVVKRRCFTSMLTMLNIQAGWCSERELFLGMVVISALVIFFFTRYAT